MINEKRLKVEFEELTEQVKQTFEQAGYDFWKLEYNCWPYTETNSNWWVHGAKKGTTETFAGRGKTVKEAITDAIKDAKKKGVDQCKL